MTWNRREFLWAGATGLAGTLAGAKAFTQSARADESGKYQGPIIDTHTHFYDPTRPHGVPWPPQNDKVLYRRVLPADYKALPKPQPVTGTVVVEASPWVEDNQWILDLAAKETFIVGFVGNLAVGAEDFRPNLARFSTNQLFRGIRIGADRLRLGLPRARFIDDVNHWQAGTWRLMFWGAPTCLRT
jgi:predicted TIM-barrel fold metal-dependent hydrolase